ncbi:hypothetical protein X975_20232, partial [Stegodyphus mimosarum]
FSWFVTASAERSLTCRFSVCGLSESVVSVNPAVTAPKTESSRITHACSLLILLLVKYLPIKLKFR